MLRGVRTRCLHSTRYILARRTPMIPKYVSRSGRSSGGENVGKNVVDVKGNTVVCGSSKGDRMYDILEREAEREARREHMVNMSQAGTVERGLSPLNLSIYDEPDAPRFHRVKGPPRPCKEDQTEDKKERRKGGSKRAASSRLSPNDKRLEALYYENEGIEDGDESDDAELESIMRDGRGGGRYMNKFAPAFEMTEGISNAMDEYYDEEVRKGEGIGDMEDVERKMMREMMVIENTSPEELEQILVQKDGKVKGMYTLDDLEHVDEQTVLHSLGIWGSVDPVPDEILRSHSVMNEGEEDEGVYTHMQGGSMADDALSDDSDVEDGLGGIDSGEEDNEGKIKEFLRKEGIFEDGSGDFIAGDSDGEGEERDIGKSHRSSERTTVKEWESTYVPEHETVFEYGSADVNTEDEKVNAVLLDDAGSDEDDGVDYASNPFAHLDDPETTSAPPEEGKKESKYAARIRKNSQHQKLKGLDELDPYSNNASGMGASKLQRLIEAAKRKKLAGQFGKVLKEPRPREGKPPHKRQLTLAALFENHLDEIFSSDVVTYKDRVNFHDVIEVVNVSMTGDLQIIKVVWKLQEGGSQYTPAEYNYSEKPEIRRSELHKDRPERRERARQYIDSLKNEKEGEVEETLTKLSKRIRFELARRVTMKRMPHIIFKLDFDEKKDNYVRDAIAKDVQRGLMSSDVLNSDFYKARSI